MRNRIPATVLLVVLFASGILSADTPEFVDWSNDGAWQRDNGSRGELTLNGWWRWQTFDTNAPGLPAAGWAFRKVPGHGPNFKIMAEAGEDFLAGKATAERRKATDGACWVEREFTVPPAWDSRDVRIVLDSVQGQGEVFLDGQRLGVTWPFLGHEIPLAKPLKTDPYRLTIRCASIINNVWLKALPVGGAEVRDCYLMTSVRNMAATLRASGTGAAARAVRAMVTDYKQPENAVKTAGPFPVVATTEGWSVEQSFPWPDASPWSLDHPNLYQYIVEVLDAQGKVLDRIFPIRFGFREVWAEGGRFMLNSRPITLNMDVHTPLATGHSGWIGKFIDEQGWREIIGQWKRIGINTAIHRWSQLTDDSTLYRVADEEGFFISTDVFGFQYGMPEANRLPDEQAYKRNMNVYRLLYRRHCPSLVFYYLPGTANTWDFEPSKLGEDYDTEALFGRHNHPEREFITAFDPTRIGFAGSGGGKQEPVHSSMNYIHIDADLQVHETWPSHWYTKQTKPLATYEMAAPPYIADWYQRQSRGEQAHARKGNLPYWLEVGAIYLGEAPYLNEPHDSIKAWLESGRKKTWVARATWTYPKVSELFIRNVYRSWRTYGVNMALFTQLGRYIDGCGYHKAQDVDPRRPGLVPDRDMREVANVARHGDISEQGKVAQAALRELVVYIGGADGEFARKDRAWFAGEEVRKAVVMLNNFDDPVTVSGSWELLDGSSNAVLKGEIPSTTLAGGEIAPARTHIAFTAPNVETRTVYTLAMHGQANRPGALEDAFELAVFPRPVTPAMGQGVKVHLYDPVGDTRAVLKQAGVAFEDLAGTLPDPGNLLVVGRNALKDEANRKAFGALLYRKMGYDFATNLRNGMRVLVFEQALDNVWGLQTEQSRWRRAFIAAHGHPVLKGLGAGDFLYLRGDSDLVEPYPPAPPGKVARVATDRFPEWGNDNSVVTYSLVRPQLGACRALVACGFDLQEAALLEATGGEGRIVFCQVDVSNRYGTDPVSTILVNNLLSYMTRVAEPDPSVGKPIDLVREGWEDYDVEVSEETDIFMLDRPDGEISWGITAAETYFQGFLNVPVLKGPDGERYLYGPVPGERAFGHLLNRRKFETRWQKMKAMQVRAALWINQGGSADTFPEPGLQDDAEELYPLDWLQGFVHPYLFMNW